MYEEPRGINTHTRGIEHRDYTWEARESAIKNEIWRLKPVGRSRKAIGPPSQVITSGHLRQVETAQKQHAMTEYHRFKSFTE